MSQEGKYEIHLTVATNLRLEGWKSSFIDGDPVLGSGKRHYLTSYASSLNDANDKMNLAINNLNILKIQIIRTKIEYIVFDQVF